MNNTDIKQLINNEIDKYMKDHLDNQVSKILKSSDSKSRKELINSIKNSLDAVYKVLWQKKEFWKSDIK